MWKLAACHRHRLAGLSVNFVGEHAVDIDLTLRLLYRELLLKTTATATDFCTGLFTQNVYLNGLFATPWAREELRQLLLRNMNDLLSSSTHLTNPHATSLLPVSIYPCP